MKRLVSGFVVLWGVLATSFSSAEWVNLSQHLLEQDIRRVVSDAQDPKLIFAASEKKIYRTVDGGISWNEVLRLRAGVEQVQWIHIDAGSDRVIYVCSDRGVYRSMDRGKSWELFFKTSADGTQKILCVANDAAKPELLWIGTDHGLIQMDMGTHDIHKVQGLPDVSVYSILLNRPKTPSKIITTSRGVYRHLGEGENWEKVFTGKRNETEPSGESVSQQFGTEEIPVPPLFSNVIFLSGQNKFYSGTYQGVIQGAGNASSWKPIEGATLPDQKINFIAGSQKTIYIATDRGVFQWDESSHLFRELYLGLESLGIRSLDYNVLGDYLLAATKKGVYRWSNPELNLSLPAKKDISGYVAHEILSRLSTEPSILEVQEAAIRYAEVQPQKIEQWRWAAARKAWAPTFSFHQDYQTSDNIDVDRGGTGDPDKFIRGPQEKDQDRYFTVSWDLGELIWNGDQTSIDSRSKLMVELRNDILNEVTHLYYERRRLQVKIMTHPVRELAGQVEYQIRLDELTSQIDALTGGYFSKRLAANT